MLSSFCNRLRKSFRPFQWYSSATLAIQYNTPLVLPSSLFFYHLSLSCLPFLVSTLLYFPHSCVPFFYLHFCTFSFRFPFSVSSLPSCTSFLSLPHLPPSTYSSSFHFFVSCFGPKFSAPPLINKIINYLLVFSFLYFLPVFSSPFFHVSVYTVQAQKIISLFKDTLLRAASLRFIGCK